MRAIWYNNQNKCESRRTPVQRLRWECRTSRYYPEICRSCFDRILDQGLSRHGQVELPLSNGPCLEDCPLTLQPLHNISPHPVEKLLSVRWVSRRDELQLGKGPVELLEAHCDPCPLKLASRPMLLSHCQNDSELCFAAQHPRVRFARFFERIRFNHGTYAA